jgi:nitrogen-specific signal transduction histidine kinase
MDEDIVKKIFDTIFAIEQNLGDLVGLSAACCIIQKHKGAICVDTEHGDGSKFHIYLPLMQGD